MLDVFSDHLTDDLRSAQIAFNSVSHQKSLVLLGQTNGYCCVAHAFHSFHYYVQKGAVQVIAVAQKIYGSYSEPRGERRGFFICSGCLIRECCFPLMQFSPA